jgi:hypothetical protein
MSQKRQRGWLKVEKRSQGESRVGRLAASGERDTSHAGERGNGIASGVFKSGWWVGRACRR